MCVTVVCSAISVFELYRTNTRLHSKRETVHLGKHRPNKYALYKYICGIPRSQVAILGIDPSSPPRGDETTYASVHNVARNARNRTNERRGRRKRRTEKKGGRTKQQGDTQFIFVARGRLKLRESSCIALRRSTRAYQHQAGHDRGTIKTRPTTPSSSKVKHLALLSYSE